MDLKSHVGHMVQLPPAAPRLNSIVLGRERERERNKKQSKRKEKKIAERKSSVGIRLDIRTTLKA